MPDLQRYWTVDNNKKNIMKTIIEKQNKKYGTDIDYMHIAEKPDVIRKIDDRLVVYNDQYFSMLVKGN